MVSYIYIYYHIHLHKYVRYTEMDMSTYFHWNKANIVYIKMSWLIKDTDVRAPDTSCKLTIVLKVESDKLWY